MKKKYVTPEADMMQFVESEEIMTASAPDVDLGVVENPGWD